MAIVAVVALAGVVSRPSDAAASTVPPLDHVFLIVMENRSYGEVIGSSSAPYINNLAGSGALATSYFAVAHPSLPNYLALTAGSTFGVSTDCTTCFQPYNHVGDLLETANKTWKAYEESMPSPCFVGDSYPYAQKHDPFIYYDDVRTNASRCQSHVVPYSQLATDLRSTSTTPNYAFITPNMCDDMHDCSVSTGDSWLQQQVPAILGSPAFTTQHSLLVVTWDEDDYSGSNQVATIFAGPAAKAVADSATTYNHYSLLHTIEVAFGVGTLTSNDAAATPMGDMFAAPATSPTPCSSVTSSVSPSSPQVAGTVLTFSALAAGCPNPLYQFWVLYPGATSYAIAQPYGPSSTFTWNTSGLGAGTYKLTAWARDASSSGVYTNYEGSWDAYYPSTYTLNPGSECTGASEAATPSGAAMAGMQVTVTAQAAACPNPQYEFWVQAPGAAMYTLAQAYSSSSTLSWATSGLAAGTYRVNVWVRDLSSAGVYSNPWGSWDAYDAGLYYTLTAGCPSVSGSATPSGAAMAGMPVTFTESAPGCSNPEYEFWILAPAASLYRLAQPYGTSASLQWKTSGLAPGVYRIDVWVRDATSPGVSSNAWGSWDAYDASLYYTLTAGCPAVSEPAATTASAGTTVAVTASAPGCPDPQYEFWVLAPGASLYTLAQPYGPSTTLSWSTVGLAPGTYRITVWVRDAASPGVSSNSWGSWDAYAASLYVTLA